MTSRTRRWLLPVAMAAALAGCEDQGPGIDGDHFLSARIDGSRPWLVGPCRGQVIAVPAANNHLVVVASLSLDQGATEEILQLDFPTEEPLRPWNYPLGAGITDGHATFTLWFRGQVTEFYGTSAIRRGLVQVTATEPSDGVLAGAFSFEAVAADGRSTRHFRGEFRTGMLSTGPDRFLSPCPEAR